MPYPNEHSARLKEPGGFNPKSFRRTNDGMIYGKIKVPQTVAVIWGKLKGKDKPSDQPIPQALRFPTKNWTAEQAKKWLKDNNVKYIRFEPASGGKKSEADHIPIESVQVNIQGLLAQLKSQIWAMETKAFESLIASIQMQTTAPPTDLTIEKEAPSLRIVDRVAVIPIRGVLMRHLPAAFAWYRIEATSYLTIQEQIKMALADETVKQIRLEVDSPGGTVPGVLETAEAIRAATKTKVVTAHVDGLCASGAYWLTSQADHIESVKNGMAGSIGVFCVYVDSSERAKELGFKIHIIRSGEHKGMGIPGAEITDTQIAGVQEIIDGTADNFIQSVAAGRQRKKDEVRGWATGQLWLAEPALHLGLIDKVTSPKKISIPSKEKAMNEEMTDQQIDAQIAENEKAQADLDKRMSSLEQRERKLALQEAFPDDRAYALKCHEEGLTVDQAKAQRYDEEQKRRKKQQNSQTDTEATSSGAPPIVSEDTDSQASDFMTTARELADEKKISLTTAMKIVRRKNPQLHEAFKQRCREE